MTPDESCADTLEELAGLQLYLQVSTDGPARGGEIAASGQWLSGADLARPDQPPLAGLLARFAVTGRTTNRRVASASFLLRFGWVSGFAIASYLACDRVPRLSNYAVLFAPTSLLHALRIRAVTFHDRSQPPSRGGGAHPAPGGPRVLRPKPAWLRERLLTSLWQLSEPVVAAQHAWSRFSRHALWSMVTSSWGAQFTSLARQLGDAPRGIAEARALFALHPELSRAAPELYEVCEADSACTCQRRAACCLYFKRPGQPFCASCPLLPEAERLERNRQWVRAQRPVVCA
jgi:hypothetical protein